MKLLSRAHAYTVVMALRVTLGDDEIGALRAALVQRAVHWWWFRVWLLMLAGSLVKRREFLGAL
jgi:hypothetical protein